MLYFENDRLGNNEKELVQELIDNGEEISGNIKVEAIPENEVDYYDDSDNFIRKHTRADFYMVYNIVCGSWEQPICMVAEEY